MSLHAVHATGMIIADGYDDLGIAPKGQVIWVTDGEVLKLCTYNAWNKTWVWARPNAHGCADCTHSESEIVKNCQVGAELMQLPEVADDEQERA